MYTSPSGHRNDGSNRGCSPLFASYSFDPELIKVGT